VKLKALFLAALLAGSVLVSAAPIASTNQSDRITNVVHHFSHELTLDRKGHIIRSKKSKQEFERLTGYPHGRPGYVVDHVVALKHGGVDCPCNMQWQTVEDAKAKDKWE